MRKIKISNIPNTLMFLETTSNERILSHVGEIWWSRNNRKEYEEVENLIETKVLIRDNYKIFTSCDISGYVYWAKKNRKDNYNYIQIGIEFNCDSLSFADFEQLEKDVNEVYDFFLEYESYDSNDYLSH